ncbi:MAG: OB-fold protein [Bacteroidota bacterium]
MNLPFTKKTRIRILLALVVLGLSIGGGIAYYLITEKFEDTALVKAAYSVSALQFLKEFQENDSLANDRYRDRIVELKGRVTSIEWADTSANIKMETTESSDYLIFDFQRQDATKTKSLRSGDSILVRASCSGSVYSRILNSRSVQFKRASLIQKF